MRKMITLQLWVDDDMTPNGGTCYMNDNDILDDIYKELKRCKHDFEITKFETMEIHNEKCFTFHPDDILQHGTW